MGAKSKMSSLGQPVPELPVDDVERARALSRRTRIYDRWLYPDKQIGAVTRERSSLFSEEEATV